MGIRSVAKIKIVRERSSAKSPTSVQSIPGTLPRMLPILKNLQPGNFPPSSGMEYKFSIPLHSWKSLWKNLLKIQQQTRPNVKEGLDLDVKFEDQTGDGACTLIYNEDSYGADEIFTANFAMYFPDERGAVDMVSIRALLSSDDPGILYCSGYGSQPNTDQLEQLRSFISRMTYDPEKFSVTAVRG